MIKETSRCGHQNVHAFLKLSDLWIDVDSAKNHGGAQGQKPAIRFEIIFHLSGQLPGWGQNQCPGQAGVFVPVQVLKNGQGKGQRFSRSRFWHRQGYLIP